ncbi:hypothetical protein NPIL_639641 [Nephila pilipes]|uniref:Uncharacterized protein n=1 Tax=Nephila pilipes TaxID=299642 RepID=A0A8X6U352_NEPPI|nr:hypothetical protein NPIL_639641 [Nephila pilipes]
MRRMVEESLAEYRAADSPVNAIPGHSCLMRTKKHKMPTLLSTADGSVHSLLTYQHDWSNVESFLSAALVIAEIIPQTFTDINIS